MNGLVGQFDLDRGDLGEVILLKDAFGSRSLADHCGYNDEVDDLVLSEEISQQQRVENKRNINILAIR